MITIVGQKATSSLVVSLTHLILALGTTAPFVCLTLALVSLPQVPIDVVPSTYPSPPTFGLGWVYTMLPSSLFV